MSRELLRLNIKEGVRKDILGFSGCVFGLSFVDQEIKFPSGDIALQFLVPFGCFKRFEPFSKLIEIVCREMFHCFFYFRKPLS